MTNGDGWVLVDFVGGPMDGAASKVEATKLAALVKRTADYTASYRNYRLVDPPDLDDDSFDRWEERERGTIATFAHGPPDFYIQMVWHPPDPTSTIADEHEDVRSVPRSPSAGLIAQQNRLTGALIAGDETLVTSMVTTFSMRDTSTTNLIESLLAPALRQIGEDWLNGTITIFVEHRASCIVQRILAREVVDPGPVQRGRAVVTTLGGERHALPTEMAAAALREDGWLVDLLGADTPIDELTSMNASSRIDLIVLSVTLRSETESTLLAAETLRREGFRVLVGGPGKGLGELRHAARAEFAY